MKWRFGSPSATRAMAGRGGIGAATQGCLRVAACGIHVRTSQNWEQGGPRSDTAVVSLTWMFAHAPELVEDVLTEPVM